MSIVADKDRGKLNGRFRVQVMVNYIPYRRRVNSLGEAKALEAEWLAAKARGEMPAIPAPGAARTAIEAVSAPEAPQVALVSLPLSQARLKAEGRIWAGKTEENCLSQLKVIEELMGDVALNAIDTAWAMDLKDKLKTERRVSDGTCNRYFAAFSRFLKWSRKCGYRTVDEMPEFEFGKEAEGRIRWISVEEEAELMRLLPERTAKLARFAILTGGRRGELLALKPDAVFPDRIIFWGGGTKSGKSRPILLTEEGLTLAKWLVVEGNMPNAQQLRTDWKAARKAMGLLGDKEFVFHGCRHTFAVRAVEAGVPIRTLQQWMGHETIEMTEKYGKVSGLALEKARDLMFAQAA
jgi:integrase